MTPLTLRILGGLAVVVLSVVMTIIFYQGMVAGLLTVAVAGACALVLISGVE